MLQMRGTYFCWQFGKAFFIASFCRGRCYMLCGAWKSLVATLRWTADICKRHFRGCRLFLFGLMIGSPKTFRCFLFSHPCEIGSACFGTQDWPETTNCKRSYPLFQCIKKRIQTKRNCAVGKKRRKKTPTWANTRAGTKVRVSISTTKATTYAALSSDRNFHIHEGMKTSCNNKPFVDKAQQVSAKVCPCIRMASS